MPTRRTFLSSVLGATLTAPVAAGEGATSSPPRRKIRVGALNVGEYTFWGVWADILSAKEMGTPLLNMEVTHCWDINPKLASAFAERNGCVAVEKYDGMLGKVDAIAFGGFYEVPWQHLLAKPYVEAGVPTYLSRPFSYRLRDIDSILELAAKHNTRLMATSVGEHFYESTYLKYRLKDLGVIQSAHGVCRSGEYPAHFHIQWFILRALGYDVDKVSLLTDDERKATYLQETMLFQGRDGQPPYLASIHAKDGVPYFHLNVRGDKATESVLVERSPDRREMLYHYFAPQLVDMQRAFEGDSFQSFDIIRKKTQLFLAGYYSHLEKSGALVPVGSVPVDWSPRHYKPGWIDEKMFEG